MAYGYRRNLFTGEEKQYLPGPAKQSWEVGEIVNVGFVKGLQVVRKVPTPGDYAPDAYLLVSRTGKHYRFTPHLGLERAEG